MIHFFIFERRTVSAVDVDSAGIVIGINVFENQLMCMIVIADFESVKPLSFD